jgi:hypothetical protein
VRFGVGIIQAWQTTAVAVGFSRSKIDFECGGSITAKSHPRETIPPQCEGNAAMVSRNNDTNFDSFRGILAELLAAHGGKYALVHDGDLLGISQLQVFDDEGQSDRAWCSVLAQVAGLSAMVSETCFVSPTRRSPIVTVWPMLSGPRARKTDCTCRIGSPFQSTTMSPW